jgi:hypothetical protein
MYVVKIREEESRCILSMTNLQPEYQVSIRYKSRNICKAKVIRNIITQNKLDYIQRIIYMEGKSILHKVIGK